MSIARWLNDLVREGGIRIPEKILSTYRLDAGDELAVERQSDGTLLRPVPERLVMCRREAYKEMVSEQAEDDEWSDWEPVVGDEW